MAILYMKIITPIAREPIKRYTAIIQQKFSMFNTKNSLSLEKNGEDKGDTYENNKQP